MNRSITAGFAIVALASALQAQQPARVAAPSTRATVTVSLAGPEGSTGVVPAEIRIDYGQPHLRGRKLHTPGFVPLDSVWRLGANAPTTLETGVDLMIETQRLAKGKYLLFALPTAAGWKLIVNSNIAQTGADHSPQHDLAKIDLRRRALASTVESLTIALIPSRAAGVPSGELRISWGDAEYSADWRVP